MKTRTIGIVLVCLACIGGTRLIFPAADSEGEKERLRSKVEIFMRAKLFSSQSVLEGLTTENFD